MIKKYNKYDILEITATLTSHKCMLKLELILFKDLHLCLQCKQVHAMVIDKVFSQVRPYVPAMKKNNKDDTSGNYYHTKPVKNVC